MCTLTVWWTLEQSGRALAASTTQPQVAMTLRVVMEVEVEHQTVERARNEVRAILGRAGVELNWLTCGDRHAHRPSHDPCDDPPGPADFWLRIGRNKPAVIHVDTLGYAELDTVQKTGAAGVVYTAVEEIAQRRRADVYEVLAAAIVHEVGHLLLGGAGAHSCEGVMVAHWGASEFKLVRIGELRFTPTQAKQMRDEIRRRRVALAGERMTHLGR
jgi:hypothetical protein